MTKPRLKMAMAAAEMLYSAAHERAGMPGPQRGPHPLHLSSPLLVPQPG